MSPSSFLVTTPRSLQVQFIICFALLVFSRQSNPSTEEAREIFGVQSLIRPWSEVRSGKCQPAGGGRHGLSATKDCL